jgi:hypothetical protein
VATKLFIFTHQVIGNLVRFSRQKGRRHWGTELFSVRPLNITNRWTEAAESASRIRRDPAKVLGDARPINSIIKCSPLMSRQYYILWYRLDGSDSFLIWHSDETDGVFVEADGCVPSFKDAASLSEYATERDISVDTEEPILLNLDVLGKWLKRKDVGSVEPHNFIDAWNLFADVSHSVNGDFDANQQLTRKIYDKLFWACNLPSVTPDGESYRPSWTRRELEIMHDVLGSGLQMFRRSVKGS